jgi:phage terminase Nu1 subunit (DNA packaging protein)
VTSTHDSADAPPSSDEKLLTDAALAELLGGDVSVRTLERWRRQGLGPDYITLSRGGKLIRYRPQAVRRWLDGLERKRRAGAAA